MDENEELLCGFIEKINRIVSELNGLQNFAYDIFQEYNSNKFPEQEDLSVQLENLAIAITHEAASQISFLKNNIENISKFILFREEYNEFNDAELEEVLDNNPTSEFKKNLLFKFGNAESMVNKMNEVRQNWNIIFNNSSYLKIKKKLHI